MKTTIKKTLSKPKIIIPAFAVLAIAATVIGFKYVGKAPIINILPDTNSSILTSTLNTTNLGFPKSGRISEVSVVIGQDVHRGDILAKISAPDQEGLINQTKGALDLAEAEYSSLNSQYATTKKQQDLIVSNAYQTLLSSGLEGVPSEQDKNTPIISGTYTCGKEGTYTINPYASSDSDTGHSFNFSGLESGVASIKFENSVPLGNCGLQIKWSSLNYFNDSTDWTIDIPNKKSSTYLANKNTYELAIANREKILSDLSNTIGAGDEKTSVAKAKVEAARGNYEAAVGSYQNNIITSPIDGKISFVDKDLKVGQSIVANKNIISIIAK